MPKITHSGPTNAAEAGYFEAIDARQAEGLPADVQAYAVAPMSAGSGLREHGDAAVARYEAALALLEGVAASAPTSAEAAAALAALGDPPVWP